MTQTLEGPGDRPSFRARLHAALEEAVLVGIKWGVVAILTLWAVSWAMGDYVRVRQQARQGQAAFEYLQQHRAPTASPAVPSGR